MKPTSWLFVTNMLLASTYGWGQQPITFDTVRLNQVNSFLTGHSVFETGTGYLVFGMEGAESGSVQDPTTLSFDGLGNYISSRSFINPRRVDIGARGPVTECALGGYACGANLFLGDGELGSLYLYRFNELGDTLWTELLLADTTVAVRRCIETMSGDFVMVGFHEPPRDALVLRTDQTATYTELYTLDVPPFFALGVAEDANTDLYLCGYGRSAAQNNNNNANLVKVTANGDVVWRRVKPRESWFTHVIAVDDGVVAMGYWRQNTFGESVAFAMKYSSTGDSLWQRNLQVADNIIEPCQLNDGFEDADGNLILCGTVENYNNVFNDKGLLYKLSPAGDVIWSRDYAHYGGQNGYHPQVFNAVQPTRDGGFILTGETWGPSPPNPSRLWLLKLDSLGCLVPGCNTVGVEDFESQLQSALSLSPNPSSALVHIELPLPDGYRLIGTVQAILLDAQGKEVLRSSIGNTGLGLSGNLDVSGLPSGLYYLHLRDAQKWLAGGKLVVE